MGKPRSEREDAFWSRVVPTGFCWEWTGYRLDSGYGRMSFAGRMQVAHRIAYQILVGEIPNGLQLDHLCRNRGCVNPDHLEPVTAQENMRRGFSPTSVTVRDGVCKRGHSMEDAYITTSAKGRPVRRCRKCTRVAQLVKVPAAYERTCRECGGEFTARQKNKTYCSAKCVQRAYVRRRDADA